MIAEKETRISRVESEVVPCPLCGRRENEILHAFRDDHGNYALSVCSACRMHYLSPRPTLETIGVYYEASHYTPFLSSDKKNSLFVRIYRIVRNQSVAWKRRKIEKIKPTASLLDIGCGTGEFLHEMRRNGWKVRGLEPSPEASQFARKELELEVTTGFIDLQGMNSVAGHYDVITMWHVLEHVHQPNEALQLVKNKMAEDGLLVIAVPNISSLDARIYGKDWVALDVPRHLLHFTPETMRKLIMEAGMTVIRCHQMPLDTVFNSLMSEVNVIKRNSKFLAPLFLFRTAFTILISWLSGLNRDRGSSVMYYIRKQRTAA